jgi:hypothetical protein
MVKHRHIRITRIIIFYFYQNIVSGLVVRVAGYTTDMYCVCCEVRTEFIYVM